MSCTLNGEPLVSWQEKRPRNYTDQVTLTRELRKEILHQLWDHIKEQEYEKWDEERLAKKGKDQFFLTDFGRADTRFGM